MGEETKAKESFTKFNSRNKYNHDQLDSHLQTLISEYKDAIEEIHRKESPDPELQNMLSRYLYGFIHLNRLDKEQDNCQLMYDIAAKYLEKEKYQEAIDY